MPDRVFASGHLERATEYLWPFAERDRERAEAWTAHSEARLVGDRCTNGANLLLPAKHGQEMAAGRLRRFERWLYDRSNHREGDVSWYRLRMGCDLQVFKMAHPQVRILHRLPPIILLFGHLRKSE